MKTLPVLLAAGAMALAAAVGGAQIERLDLTQMVQRADDAVLGTIVERHVMRIDHPDDGPNLYYTSLTVEGRSLATGQPKTVDVWFGGGFVSETEGVFNSEAPSMDDQKLGNRVLVFHKFEENMGGDLSGEALMCWHGGLYRTFDARGNTVVQGRGDGYAIAANVKLEELRASLGELYSKKQK